MRVDERLDELSTLATLRIIVRFVLVWFAMWLASLAVWSFVAWALWLAFLW